MLSLISGEQAEKVAEAADLHVVMLCMFGFVVLLFCWKRGEEVYLLETQEKDQPGNLSDNGGELSFFCTLKN